MIFKSLSFKGRREGLDMANIAKLKFSKNKKLF